MQTTNTSEWPLMKEVRQGKQMGKWLGLTGLSLFLILLQFVLYLLLSGHS